MRQFIASTISDELLEAAHIAGAAVFGSFIRIVLPVVGAGAGSARLPDLRRIVKRLPGPMLLLHKPEVMTAPLALVAFQGSSRVAPKYSMLFAGSVHAAHPLHR